MTRKTYKIRDLGEANTFLGMEITRNRAKRTLKISQTTYISKMAERFDVTKNKPKYVPLDPNVILKKAKTTEETEGVDNELYRSIIGSCMYAVQCCRPDALLAVSRLSQYLNNPSKMHMKHAQFLLTYLYTTRNQGITYGKIIHGITGHSLNEFYGFSDADYAGNVDKIHHRLGFYV